MNPRARGDNQPVDGPRACLPHELPALIAAANRVFRPSGGDMGRDYPLLFSAARLDNLRVIADGDRILAHAGLCVRPAALGGVTVEVGALGAVFTREDHRHRGLAAAVAGDALACARALGARLALVSGDGPLYRRLGFSTVPEVACWDCAPPGGPSPAVRVRPCREDDIDQLARLNDAEPVHFVRDASDWRALLRASVIFAWPARLWLVEEGDGNGGDHADADADAHGDGAVGSNE
jgi:predicted N-acetyltransferase YhbS